MIVQFKVIAVKLKEPVDISYLKPYFRLGSFASLQTLYNSYSTSVGDSSTPSSTPVFDRLYEEHVDKINIEDTLSAFINEFHRFKVGSRRLDPRDLREFQVYYIDWYNLPCRISDSNQLLLSILRYQLVKFSWTNKLSTYNDKRFKSISSTIGRELFAICLDRNRFVSAARYHISYRILMSPKPSRKADGPLQQKSSSRPVMIQDTVNTIVIDSRKRFFNLAPSLIFLLHYLSKDAKSPNYSGRHINRTCSFAVVNSNVKTVRQMFLFKMYYFSQVDHVRNWFVDIARKHSLWNECELHNFTSHFDFKLAQKWADGFQLLGLGASELKDIIGMDQPYGNDLLQLVEVFGRTKNYNIGRWNRLSLFYAFLKIKLFCQSVMIF